MLGFDSQMMFLKFGYQINCITHFSRVAKEDDIRVQ